MIHYHRIIFTILSLSISILCKQSTFIPCQTAANIQKNIDINFKNDVKEATNLIINEYFTDNYQIDKGAPPDAVETALIFIYSIKEQNSKPLYDIMPGQFYNDSTLNFFHTYVNPNMKIDEIEYRDLEEYVDSGGTTYTDHVVKGMHFDKMIVLTINFVDIEKTDERGYIYLYMINEDRNWYIFDYDENSTLYGN